MRPQDQVARAKRARRTRRALQIATCLSVLVLSCSVYDANLLSGSGALQGSEAGTGSLPDAGADSIPGGAGGAAASEGGQAGEAGAQNQAQGGDSSAGEAGSVEQGSGGATVIVTYGGASGSDGGAGGSGAATGSAGGAGASAAGTAGSPPVVKELGKNKKATASSFEAGNDIAKGNDGDSGTRWCAASDKMPQWWRVDLGATHELTQVVVKFEHPERKYTYVIETSPNDAVFTQRAMANGTGDTQTIDIPAGVSARYLRVTVTAGAPYTDSGGVVRSTWASFWELRVYGY
jgi:F5/8 type C domain